MEDNMHNLTSVSEFLLLEFSEVRDLQIVHFFVFLVLYLTTVAGNLLIIVVISLDHHLHTPMYFFILNLAVLDLGTVSVMIPKSMANSLMNKRSISYWGCVAQVFFYFFFAAANFGILTVMAKDRYVAICHPLHYETIMHKEACIQLAVIAWVGGLLYATLHTGGTFAISFCSNVVSQFFCEIPHLLTLSCTDLYLLEVGFLVLGCCTGVGCFIYMIATYVLIFTTVLKLPSVQGQKKALATCVPHLIVVFLLVFSETVSYEKPPTHVSSKLDVIVAVVYCVLSPMLNPFIYSMRNKDIKGALWKLLDSCKTTSK